MSNKSDLEALRAVINDPVKLEEGLKKAFAEMDKEKKGYVSFETVHKYLEAGAAKHGKIIHEEDHKPGDLDKARKVCDPTGKDRVEYEGFKTLVLGIIKYAKDEKAKHAHGHGH